MGTMRAMQLDRIGGTLAAVSLPLPEPGPGAVRIRVRAAGVNFADTLMVAGRYQERPAPPFVPGLEVAGVVEALGPGVTAPALGTRVAAYVGQGGFAEAVTAPAAACTPLPDAIGDADAAGFLIAHGTAHLAFEQAGLALGETVLVTGAGGGVGLTGVAIGRAMGARVIASARGAAKLAAARQAGADHLIEADADLAAEVKALGGADVVYDAVGGETFAACLRAVRPFGRLIPIGFAGGAVPQIPANILLVKNLTVIGHYWGAVARDRPQRAADSIARLLALVAAGRLTPPPVTTLPLTEAEAALEALRSRSATGKIVLVP